MSTINYTPSDLNFTNDTTSSASKPDNPLKFFVVLVFVFIITFLATILYLHNYRNYNIRTVAVPVDVPAITLQLKTEAIDSIPTFSHESIVVGKMGKYEKEECAICLGMFEHGERVKVLPVCLHAYHSDCVDKWLRNKLNCPLCRSSIYPASTKSATDDSAIVY